VLHREILKDYTARITVLSAARDSLEARFRKEAGKLISATKTLRAEFSEKCFSEVDDAEARWLEEVLAIPVKRRNSFYYNYAWKKLNKDAELPE
jgi:hypothetical protein